MPADATRAAADDPEHAMNARVDPTWGWAIQDGKPIHVNEVARRLACECRCPECGDELIAKKGPLRAHHFAHHKQSTCAERGESALHEALKNVFARTRTLMLCEARWDVDLPWWVYNEAAQNEALERLSPLKGTREARGVVFDEVRTEPTLGAIRPDATATKDGRTLAIEFRVTNGVDETKRREYERQKLSCIEVNASKMPRDASREAIVQREIGEIGKEHLGPVEGVRCVITGHTPEREPTWHENVLGIDTGVHITERGYGRLTIARIEGKEIETSTFNWKNPDPFRPSPPARRASPRARPRCAGHRRAIK